MTDWSALAARFQWQDALDVALLTFVGFHIFKLLRGTVALQALGGLGMLLLLYFMAAEANLILTAYVLQGLGAVALVVIAVVFQDEIRRVLRRADPTRFWRRWREGKTEIPQVEPLAAALVDLAEQRLGALIILPRHDHLDSHVSGGTRLDAIISTDLLRSIFQTNSPIHDGASIVRNGRVIKAGVFLPLSSSPGIPEKFGTRHRAALGLSEACDALVVVVSEERGDLSIAVDGSIRELPLDASTIISSISKAAEAKHVEALSRQATRSDMQALPRRRFLGDALALSTIFVVVAIARYAVVSGRTVVMPLRVPIEVRNPPGDHDVVVLTPLSAEVTLTVRGPRRLLESRARSEFSAWVDASDVKLGRNRLELNSRTPAGLETLGATPTHAVLRVRRSKNDSVQ